MNRRNFIKSAGSIAAATTITATAGCMGIGSGSGNGDSDVSNIEVTVTTSGNLANDFDDLANHTEPTVTTTTGSEGNTRPVVKYQVEAETEYCARIEASFQVFNSDNVEIESGGDIGEVNADDPFNVGHMFTSDPSTVSEIEVEIHANRMC